MNEVNVYIPKKAFLPIYHPLLDTDARYLILWGGRGGGRSYVSAQLMVMWCLHLDFFRGILQRKVYRDIKDSQFQTIKDIVEDWGLGELFEFKTHPIRIDCANGNFMIGKGLDKSGKTKSIKDPTHIWYEEANELTQEDFFTSTTSLRTTKSDHTKEIMSFNPEFKGDYEEFWLYKMWGPAWENKIHEGTKTVEMEGKEHTRRFISIHANYKDNRENLTKDYISTLESFSDVNPYYYRVYTLGEWGRKEVNHPYMHNFSKGVHVTDEDKYEPKAEIRISWDFNVDPLVCGLLQIYYKSGVHHVHFLEELTMFDGDVYSMCERIKSKLSPAELSNVLVTGDAMARKKNVVTQQNIHAWEIIRKQLGLSSTRLQIPKANPSIKENRNLCNAILARHPNLTFHSSMTRTINDMLFVETDEDGKIKKGNRQDDKQRADHLDMVRYAFNTWMGDFITNEEKYL